MFKETILHNPQFFGTAGTIATAAILKRLVDRGVLTPADAHEVVQEAIESLGKNDLSWAREARRVLETDFLRAFPKA